MGHLFFVFLPRKLNLSLYSSQTDNALLALAASRRSKGLPGLHTLSIISSPDLTDEGLAVYLSTTNFDAKDEAPGSTSYQGQYALGQSLVSLTLVNTPRLTVRSLLALEQHCQHLISLDLRNTDGFFEDSVQQQQVDIEDPPWSKDIFHRFIENNTALHTFTFSSGLSTLPFDLFSSFNKPQSALQNLFIYSSKAIRSQHLTYFPSIHRLTISGCLALADDLPFEYMPRLQEISFLGRGLSLSSLWKLFQHETIRKMTLDVAGSAYESCICSENSAAINTNSTISDQTAAKPHNEIMERFPFPAPLDNFKKHNILSSTIPSWAVAFFLASSPVSLESISLHGAIVPTCCSIRSSQPTPSLTDVNQIPTRLHAGYPFTYSSMLRSSILSIPFIQAVLSVLPRISTKAFIAIYRGRKDSLSTDVRLEERNIGRMNDSATAALTSLSFQSLRDLVVGTSTQSPPPRLEDGSSGDILREEMKMDVLPEAVEADDSDLSDSEAHRQYNASSANEIAPVRQDRRRHRAQSISGMPSRKAKVARKALQRSASEFMLGRHNKAATCSRQETRQAKQSGNSALCSTRTVKPLEALSGTVSSVGLPGTLGSSDIEGSSTTSAQQVADAKHAALVRLLAVSSVHDSTPPPTFSHFGNVGTSRLNPQQAEWLHVATGGRIIRLEL